MEKELRKGQRVRHRTTGYNGIILSVEGDSGQIDAPNLSYTVEWDHPSMGMKIESLIYAKEIEPIGS